MGHPHALAFVRFQPGRFERDQRDLGMQYRYFSAQPRVVDLAGKGGTLWLVTSRRRRKKRAYQLVYKLVDCCKTELPAHLMTHFGRYGIAGDKVRSRQYPSNDMNYVLMSLRFSPWKPIKSMDVIGLSLLQPRRLSDEDAELLKGYASELAHRRSIFLSYSHVDERADELVDALEDEGMSVYRDVKAIPGGTDWREEVKRAIKEAEVFLLLHSEDAERSDEVCWELKEALETRHKSGSLAIIPVVSSDADYAAFQRPPFSELCRFQGVTWESSTANKSLDLLVERVRQALIYQRP